MKKISVGQIMANLLCINEINNKEYNIFSDAWNKIHIDDRDIIIEGITEYLIDQVGKELVID